MQAGSVKYTTGEGLITITGMVVVAVTLLASVAEAVRFCAPAMVGVQAAKILPARGIGGRLIQNGDRICMQGHAVIIIRRDHQRRRDAEIEIPAPGGLCEIDGGIAACARSGERRCRLHGRRRVIRHLRGEADVALHGGRPKIEYGGFYCRHTAPDLDRYC